LPNFAAQEQPEIALFLIKNQKIRTNRRINPHKRYTFCVSRFRSFTQKPLNVYTNYIGHFSVKIRVLSKIFELSKIHAKGIPFAWDLIFGGPEWGEPG